jgi:aminoglycoside 3-N-acetyltransferase
VSDGQALPHTRESLAADLRRLGLEPGGVVLLHSSLRALGWVCGGAVAVVQALMDVLTPAGTLVVPAQTAENSEPSYWANPPVPEAWWPIIRAQMPAFDPLVSPSQHMGAIAEAVRTWPGSRRSGHPCVSFAAWGHHAESILAEHPLEDGLGERSPLRRIEELDGWILLLGVGHDSNTSLHLAQYRVPGSCRELTLGAAVLESGRRVWQTYRDLDLGTDDFEAIGAALERAHPPRSGAVGSAPARLLRQRVAVDFAERWLRAKYAAPADHSPT